MKFLILSDFQGVFSGKLEKRIKKEEFDAIIALGDFGGLKDWKPYFKKLFKFSSQGKSWLSPEEYFGKNGLRKLRNKDIEAARNVFRKLDSIAKPVLYIFGNTDDDWYTYPFANIGEKVSKKNMKFLQRLKNFRSLMYRRTRFGGLDFVGFGGYMDAGANQPKNDPGRLRRIKIREAKAERKFREILGGKKNLDILVLHYPPKGVFDIIKDKTNIHHGESVGIKMFADAIRKSKPKLVLCGHMHEYHGMRRMGKSLVVNPGDAESGKYAIVDFESLKVKFIN